MAELEKGKIGVVYPYGDAKQAPIKERHVNAASMMYLYNDTGGLVLSGDVGFIDTDGKVSATTTQGLKAVIVVVAMNWDGTTQPIDQGGQGWFQLLQHCPKVNVDGATNIKDWLITSSTMKKAHPDNSSAPPAGTFAIALTSTAGAGSVEALLVPGYGWGYDAHKDASSGVHGQGAGSHVVGSKVASGWRFEKGTYSFGAATSECLTHAVTFANAFSNTPVVVISTDFSRNDPADAACFVDVESISTTGFTLRFCNNAGTPTSCVVNWLAFGPG